MKKRKRDSKSEGDKKKSRKSKETFSNKKTAKESGSEDDLLENDDFFIDAENNEQKASDDKEEEENKDPYAGMTPEQKRISLAQEYLKKLESEVDGDIDEEEKEELVAEKLRQEVIEAKGKRQRKVADQLLGKELKVETVMRGHQLSVTCLTISEDGKLAFTGSKDSTIIKWNLETGKKLHQFKGGKQKRKKDYLAGHIGHILSISLSSDGQFLASGGTDKYVRIWDAKNNKLLETLKGHRDIVSAVSFRRTSHQLFTGSHDRTVKIWNIDDMAYVDSLYGHQSEINAIDSLFKERTITAGRDKSVRIWKVVEESQLVFRGHTASIDCISLLNEEQFVTGSEDGSLCLWTSQKKKPVFTLKNAHSTHLNGELSETNPLLTANWITSVCCLKNSDLVASGSSDGLIRFWKIQQETPHLVPVTFVKVDGFVNGLAFGPNGTFIIAAIGQEHRLGRWNVVKSARNSLQLIKLPLGIWS